MGRKLSSEAVRIVYGILRARSIFSEVNSNMFKGKKPDNFIGECVVITSLPMSRDQLQVCRVIVNVFVPNVEIKKGNVIDKSQPNLPRIEALILQVDEVIQIDTDEISIRVEDDTVIENEGFNEHYGSLRLIFRNVNID